jgi:hypothetical protein
MDPLPSDHVADLVFDRIDLHNTLKIRDSIDFLLFKFGLSEMHQVLQDACATRVVFVVFRYSVTVY